jgi:hypothetical protein
VVEIAHGRLDIVNDWAIVRSVHQKGLEGVVAFFAADRRWAKWRLECQFEGFETGEVEGDVVEGLESAPPKRAERDQVLERFDGCEKQSICNRHSSVRSEPQGFQGCQIGERCAARPSEVDIGDIEEQRAECQPFLAAYLQDRLN